MADLVPLFDKRSKHKGWLKGDFVYNLDLVWVAFINGGNVWRRMADGSTPEWLGPTQDGSLMDQAGLCVFWSDQDKPAVSLPKPKRPSQTTQPARPSSVMKPATPPLPGPKSRPSLGWSNHNMKSWLEQAETSATTDEFSLSDE